MYSECCLPDRHSLSESIKIVRQKQRLFQETIYFISIYLLDWKWSYSPFSSTVCCRYKWFFSEGYDYTRQRWGIMGWVQCSRGQCRESRIVLMECAWIDVPSLRCNIIWRGFPYNLWVWGYLNMHHFIWGTQMHCSANLWFCN